jgi:G3E family GTPase
LLRVKGFVRIAGHPGAGLVELAGGRVTLTFREWPTESTQKTQLVLIGEALDEAAIRRQLWACRVES